MGLKRGACLLTSVGISMLIFNCDARGEEVYIYDSTVDTSFDIISEGDGSSFECLKFIGEDLRQIWDKRVEGEPLVLAYIFKATFSDKHVIEISVNSEF